VIILTDTYLSDSYTTADKFDLSKIKIKRGTFLSETELNPLTKYTYMRHKLTDSGISPRVIVGQPGTVVVTDSDEHSEDGHITESAEIRNKMVQKRLKKFEHLRSEIETPKTYGPKDAKIVLACWGSTYGALTEAVDILNDRGKFVRMIHFNEVWPFPAESFLKLIKGAKQFIVVENNVTGQMAHLIRAETGLEAHRTILKYDGRPMSPTYIVNKFEGVI